MNNVIKIAALGLVAASICFVARSEAQTPKTHSIVVAGGCFWGVQLVFEHTKGVASAVSGYAGGRANTTQYELKKSWPALYRE
jgi:peptide-methionine (S)-S-oxide reductase